MKKSTERILGSKSEKDYGTSYCVHCGRRCITKQGGIHCPVHGKLKHDEVTSSKREG